MLLASSRLEIPLLSRYPSRCFLASSARLVHTSGTGPPRMLHAACQPDSFALLPSPVCLRNIPAYLPYATTAVIVFAWWRVARNKDPFQVRHVVRNCDAPVAKPPMPFALHRLEVKGPWPLPSRVQQRQVDLNLGDISLVAPRPC
ncbi:hypothetical protein LX36DRAFT_664349 [Colletotrichum falcatum]|nr:hypothetical protein LX36DRAFT_664349 [Colletotrichum falcatum]